MTDTADAKRFLSFDQIAEADDLQSEDVEVPEWGGTVRIRALDGNGMVRFLEEQPKGEIVAAAGLRLLILCATDENGNLLFTKEQLDTLRKKSYRAVNKLVKVAFRLNEFGTIEEEKTKNG